MHTLQIWKPRWNFVSAHLHLQETQAETILVGLPLQIVELWKSIILYK